MQKVRRIKYDNTTLSPIMGMAFHGTHFRQNVVAVYELLCSMMSKLPAFSKLFCRDYRGRKRVLVDDVSSLRSLDLFPAMFTAIDKNYSELMNFSLSWFKGDFGAFCYPSVKISGLRISGFKGDLNEHLERCKNCVEAAAFPPLWVDVQYGPITGCFSQGLLPGAHEVRIPHLGLMNYFGSAYLNGIFGGWDSVQNKIGNLVRPHRNGFWLEYKYRLNPKTNFYEYRNEVERKLLNQDVWGGDSKTEFQVKSIILQEMGLNEDDYDTSVLKAAVTLFTNVVGVLNKVN